MKTFSLFNDKLNITISQTDWDFLCQNRFFTDNPTEEMIQSEFVSGTGITAKKAFLWNNASEKFTEYISELKEIQNININELANDILTDKEKYHEFT